MWLWPNIDFEHIPSYKRVFTLIQPGYWTFFPWSGCYCFTYHWIDFLTLYRMRFPNKGGKDSHMIYLGFMSVVLWIEITFPRSPCAWCSFSTFLKDKTLKIIKYCFSLRSWLLKAFIQTLVERFSTITINIFNHAPLCSTTNKPADGAKVPQQSL